MTTVPQMRHAAWWTGLACALLMAGCGGGGGGDTPPLAQVKLDQTNAVDAATLTVALADVALATGQAAVDAARSSAAAPQASSTKTCSNGGTVELTWQDANGDARFGPGDMLTVGYRDCSVAVLSALLNGTTTLQMVAPAAGSPADALAMTLSFGAGLRMTDPAAGAQFDMLGSMSVAWSQDGLRRTLSIRSTPLDDLRASVPVQVNGATQLMVESLKSLDLAWQLDREAARTVTRLDYRHESDALGGWLRLVTPAPMMAYFDTYPEQGVFEVRGAQESTARWQANYVVDSSQADFALDADGDGMPELSGGLAWNQFTSGLTWWAQEFGGSPTFLAGNARSFSATDFRLLTSPGFDGIVGARETLNFQFSRPLAAGSMPAYRFERSYADRGKWLWGDSAVPADVTVHGALVTVTPRQALQHGVPYTLVPVDVGTGQSTSSISLQDALGNVVVDGGHYVRVDESLCAVITTPQAAPMIGGSATLLVDGSGSVSTNGPVVLYEWTQLDGPALVFGSAGSAQTTIAAGSPGGNGLASVRLAIHDGSGEVEYARLVVQVLADPSQSRLLYFRSEAGDYIGAGQTALYSDATGVFSDNSSTSDYINLGYTDAGDVGDWWSLSLASSNGAALQVGVYENAVRAPFHDTANGLELAGSGRGCNTLTGRFEVLDIAYGGDGKVTRLAADFEQHCEGMTPALFGSIRVNSALPVRP